MSSCVKQVWLVMLINFCLLHLQYLGSRLWLRATVSSERATSSLSGAGGNLLPTSNWTKCLSNSEPSYTNQIIIQTRCQQRFVFWSSFSFYAFFFSLHCRLVCLDPVGQGIQSVVLQVNYVNIHLLFCLCSVFFPVPDKAHLKLTGGYCLPAVLTQVFLKLKANAWSSLVSSAETFAPARRSVWGCRRAHRGFKV